MSQQQGPSDVSQEPAQAQPVQAQAAEAQRKGLSPAWRAVRILIAAAIGCILFGIGVVVWNAVGGVSTEPLTREKIESDPKINLSEGMGDRVARLLRFKEVVEQELRPSYNPITILRVRRKYGAEPPAEEFSLLVMDGGDIIYRYHQAGRVVMLIGPKGTQQVLIAPWEPEHLQKELASFPSRPRN